MIVWLLFKTAPPLPFLSTRCCVIKTTSHSKTFTFSLCDSDFLKWGLTFLFYRGGTFFSASSQVYAINISKLGLCTAPNRKLQRKCPPFNYKGIYCQPDEKYKMFIMSVCICISDVPVQERGEGEDGWRKAPLKDFWRPLCLDVTSCQWPPSTAGHCAQEPFSSSEKRK